MSPYVACYEHYRQRGQGDWFMSLVSQHLQFGVVHVTPTVFVAARRMRRVTNEAGELDIAELTPELPTANTWFLAAFWGDVRELWRFEQPLEFVAWHKLKLGENVLHIYPTSVLSRFVPPN